MTRDDTDDLVRKDMMLHFGAFITESSGHLSEYLPYYRQAERPTCEQLTRARATAASPASTPTTGRRGGKSRDRDRTAAMVGGTGTSNGTRSWEYASWIIEAREKDTPFRIHGNVMNSTPAAARSSPTSPPTAASRSPA